jgi:hypothetical protein
MRVVVSSVDLVVVMDAMVPKNEWQMICGSLQSQIDAKEIVVVHGCSNA